MNYNELKNRVHGLSEKAGGWNSVHSHEHYLAVLQYNITRSFEYCYGPDGLLQEPQKLTRQMEVTLFVLFDLAGYLEIDFDRMPPCRYYRAFGRFSFTENAYALVKGLCREQIIIEKRVHFAIGYIYGWCESLGIFPNLSSPEKLLNYEIREYSR